LFRENSINALEEDIMIFSYGQAETCNTNLSFETFLNIVLPVWPIFYARDVFEVLFK
jgi:hypothetical protein